MGYSCTKAAADTLDAIQKLYGDPTTGNTLLLGDKKYFHERGREQNDGAITGKVFVFVTVSTCIPCGTYRINPDGTIARFPHLSKKQKLDAVEDAHGHYICLTCDNPRALGYKYCRACLAKPRTLAERLAEQGVTA